MHRVTPQTQGVPFGTCPRHLPVIASQRSRLSSQAAAASSRHKDRARRGPTASRTCARRDRRAAEGRNRTPCRVSQACSAARRRSGGRRRRRTTFRPHKPLGRGRSHRPARGSAYRRAGRSPRSSSRRASQLRLGHARRSVLTRGADESSCRAHRRLICPKTDRPRVDRATRRRALDPRVELGKEGDRSCPPKSS